MEIWNLERFKRNSEIMRKVFHVTKKRIIIKIQDESKFNRGLSNEMFLFKSNLIVCKLNL
jgi:hypothetical protein